MVFSRTIAASLNCLSSPGCGHGRISVSQRGLPIWPRLRPERLLEQFDRFLEPVPTQGIEAPLGEDSGRCGGVGTVPMRFLHRMILRLNGTGCQAWLPPVSPGRTTTGNQRKSVLGPTVCGAINGKAPRARGRDGHFPYQGGQAANICRVCQFYNSAGYVQIECTNLEMPQAGSPLINPPRNSDPPNEGPSRADRSKGQSPSAVDMPQ